MGIEEEGYPTGIPPGWPSTHTATDMDPAGSSPVS